MAIGTPTSLFIGSNSVAISTNDNVWPVTLTAGAAVGSRVWIFTAMECGDATPNDPTFNTTDSKGNTWTTVRVPTRNGVTGGTVMIYSASTVLTTALVSGDTISITEPTDTFGTTRKCTAVAACTGVDDLDETALGDPGSTSSLSIGPTASTDTANEIVWAFWGGGVRAFTPGATYTEFAETASTVGTSDRQLSVEYKIVSSVGTQTATATLATSTTVVGSLSTWRATPEAGDDATHFLYDGADWQPMVAELL